MFDWFHCSDISGCVCLKDEGEGECSWGMKENLSKNVGGNVEGDVGASRVLDSSEWKARRDFMVE